MVKYVQGTLEEKKKNAKDLSNDAYAMFLYVSFFPIFFIKAYIVGTHNICLYKEVDKITLPVNSEDFGIAWLCAYRGMCGN